MIDVAQRRRRTALGWALLCAAFLMLLLALFGRVLLDRMLLGTVSNPAALMTALVVIFLALAGSGAYLLRTVRGR